MVNLGKIIVDTGFEKLAKVKLIAQYGHTGIEALMNLHFLGIGFPQNLIPTWGN